MTPEVALLCLIVSTTIAVIQVYLASIVNRIRSVLSLMQRLTMVQFLFLSISFSLLAVSFIQHDFSVAYVANHSHLDLPWYYRISAVWGAHEGSMLLWLLILAIWTVIASHSRGLLDATRVIIIGVMNLIQLGLSSFVLFTSNPFNRDFNLLNTAGQDLNPLLQDPGLILHPPILYMGYVGTAFAFAFAVAVLIRGEYQLSDVKWLRKWLLLSWAFLTAGITLGSWWAYRVLGWGGWWFWDPVENASFLPWLACTALIHALAMVKDRGVFIMWSCFLCITVFSLSLLGTFLVRSGVLTSVHAFAADPGRGLFILILFGLMIFATACLFIYRLNHWPITQPDKLGSRQFYLFSQSAIVFTVMCAILVGTLYPLFIDVLTGTKLSVGAPYFNLIFTPFVLILLGLMSAAWFQRSVLNLVMVPACVLLAWIMVATPLLRATLALALWTASVTFAAYLQTRRRQAKRPMTIATACAHLGMCVVAIGIVLTSSLSQTKDIRMAVGESAEVGSATFTLESLQGVRGPNYNAMRLNFTVQQGTDGRIHQTHAEKRQYVAAESIVSQPGIIAGFWRDFYISIGDAIPPNEWTIRLYTKPFVRWLWLGGMMILIGGLIGFSRVRCQEKIK